MPAAQITPPPEPQAPAPQPEAAPTPEVEASDTAPVMADAAFDNLRSQLGTAVAGKRPRRARRLLLILLGFVLLAAAGGGVYLILNQQLLTPPRPATAVPVAQVAAPTETPIPTITPTPTETPTVFPPTWTPTVSPTPQPTRTPTPQPTLDPAKDAELQAIQQQVSNTRGFQPGTTLTRYVIQPADLEHTASSLLSSRGALDGLADRAHTLRVLGLVNPAYSLEKYELNRFVDNVGGFYVPWTQEIFVIARTALGVEHYAFALEAARAVVDQNLLLQQADVYPVCEFDWQRCQAIRALIGGDATLAMEQWLKQSANDTDRQDVAAFRAPDLAIADEVAPPFVTREVAFPREGGRAFVQYLFQRGGWARVNRAYTTLPLSTEQILHPEKYLSGEKPIEISAPPLTSTLGAEWRLIADNVLGEWTTQLILSAGSDETARLPDDVAQAAATGWGGDRVLAFYKESTGETVAAVEWAWDTADDEAEFKQAMASYVEARFRGAALDQSAGSCWILPQQTACLYEASQRTLWLLAPDRATVMSLRSLYPDFR